MTDQQIILLICMVLLPWIISTSKAERDADIKRRKNMKN